MVTKEAIRTWFMGLQDDICASLEILDGEGEFQEDLWQRDGGGGGRSRSISGRRIEKGGVNFSAVEGILPDKIKSKLQLDNGDFFATGVSIVLHPHNPHVPIIHMNVRYFEADGGKYWFGGGIDLTPHYVVDEDAQFFHQSLKDVCDASDESFYPKFKEWADNYFFIKHRGETRGVGGIFFDRLHSNTEKGKEHYWEFVQRVGEAFVPIYSNFVENYGEALFTKKEKEWQYHRRSRYVEFNLVWDAGTKFGLETGGRTESILMSMPPMAKWEYNKSIEPDSAEGITQSKLKKGVDWDLL
ncbi:MAG: oxygen-dependent coproporphyrinogen oxidase [Saprospiraceae bacterium]|nr:oxygen-dependent coproporphyrinogen oxidase [Saprospiraceae bacterium]